VPGETKTVTGGGGGGCTDPPTPAHPEINDASSPQKIQTTLVAPILRLWLAARFKSEFFGTPTRKAMWIPQCNIGRAERAAHENQIETRIPWREVFQSKTLTAYVVFFEGKPISFFLLTRWLVSVCPFRFGITYFARCSQLAQACSLD
jgi:hypothetical protein